MVSESLSVDFNYFLIDAYSCSVFLTYFHIFFKEGCSYYYWCSVFYVIRFSMDFYKHYINLLCYLIFSKQSLLS